MNTIQDELNMATNMFGGLDATLKNRLQAVCDNPCEETWEDAYCIIVDVSGTMLTLWQAVIAVRPDFCRSTRDDKPWPMIPTADDIYMALKYATH